MGIAFFTLGSMLAPLQHLMGWFQPPGRELAARRSAAASIPCTLDPAQANRINTPARACQRRPLRVVRILEASQPRTGAGRMVISGRMADVCAELDRLAELEARAS